MPGLFHLAHAADGQRPDQRRGTFVLLELRTVALPGRAGGREYPANERRLSGRIRCAAIPAASVLVDSIPGNFIMQWRFRYPWGEFDLC